MKPMASVKNKFCATKKVILAAMLGLAWAACMASPAAAQGSRRDDIVFGPAGHPVAGATVRVCQATATGTPCAPLATVYTDATLTVAAPNPFQADGIGNYHFYAPAGRSRLQITGPQISGAITYPDVILPADVSSSGSGNNISAFGLTLGGNLTVAGNATVSGTLSSTNFNPGTLTPNTVNVLGNESVGGPRPRVDVTAFGAKGDGVTDDTVGIQAPIPFVGTAFRVNPDGGSIFFPPGVYILSQPQLPSTSAIFMLPCSGLHFLGGNGSGNAIGGAQFNRAPQTRLTGNTLGSNPNAPAVFSLFGNVTGSDTFENLTINAHNQAISMYASNENALRNVCLTTPVTGQTDNTPLKITNTFWFYMDGGCLQAGNGSLPLAEFTGEAPLGIEAPLVGLAYFTSVQGIGGGFQYIQRVNTAGSGPGNFVFRNMPAMETSGTSFLTITNATGNPGSAALPLFSEITFDNATTSDATNATNALLELNSAGTNLSGVYVLNGYAGNGGQGSAVKIDAGAIQNCHVFGGAQAVLSVIDGNGVPIGGCSVQSSNGFDYVVNTSNVDRLRSDLFTAGDTNGPAFRAAASGGRFASVALDPAMGYLFNTGNAFGFGASLVQNSAGTIDVEFANLYAPGGVTATAATGGTLAAATYYATVTSTSDNCTHQSPQSVQSTGVAISGSNNAVAVSWVAPAAGLVPVAGYCVNISTSPDLHNSAYWQPQQFGSTFVSGAGTTSATMTALPTGQTLMVTSTLAPAHRFTPSSLGVKDRK